MIHNGTAYTAAGMYVMTQDRLRQTTARAYTMTQDTL